MSAFRISLRYLGTLYALQVVFSGIVFLLADYIWLSIPLGIGFLIMVGLTGRGLALETSHVRRRYLIPMALVVGSLWQLPGLQGTIRYVTDRMGVTAYDGVTDLQDFAMETWHTAVLPLLGQIPTGLIHGYYARYYIALVAMSPLLVLVFCFSSLRLPVIFLKEKRSTNI